MPMNRVYIKTYGCQMNERDSDAVAAMLRGKGYSVIDNEQDADAVSYTHLTLPTKRIV